MKTRIAAWMVSFKEHGRLVASIVLVLVTTGFFLLWRFADGSWHEFGLNAFTETVGIGLTVFLIDRLLKEQEQRRLRPLQLAAFRDVQLFIDGLATSWRNVYSWSGKDELPPPPEPPTMAEFLTIGYFDQVRKRLNLDAEACVFPKRSWWQYLPQLEQQYRALGEKILERHASVLEPNAYYLVHRVVNGFLDPSIGLNMLRTNKQAGGFGDQNIWNALPENQRHRLGRYWIVIEDNLNDVADLHAWFSSNKRKYLGHE